MPNKPRNKTHSFSEKYYWNRFTEKQIELSKHLEKNPNDLVTKEQFQFIDKVLREGEKSDKLGKNFNWPVAWQGWEEAHLLSKSWDKWNTQKEKEK